MASITLALVLAQVCWNEAGWDSPQDCLAIAEVERPAHYTMGAIEVIDAIEAWGVGYHLGNVIKYVARAGRKGDAITDLRKARWYLTREIERMERG